MQFCAKKAEAGSGLRLSPRSLGLTSQLPGRFKSRAEWNYTIIALALLLPHFKDDSGAMS